MRHIAEQGEGASSGPARAKRDNPRKYDTMSRRGAYLLAGRLQDYWHGKGYYAARFWVEPIAERFEKIGTHELYRVMCNFVNGMPPRYVEDGQRAVAR